MITKLFPTLKGYEVFVTPVDSAFLFDAGGKQTSLNQHVKYVIWLTGKQADVIAIKTPATEDTLEAEANIVHLWDESGNLLAVEENITPLDAIYKGGFEETTAFIVTA